MKENKAFNLLLLNVLLLIIFGCNSREPSVVFLEAQNNDITMTIDSVSYPELNHFSIAFTLFNNTNKKAILILDSIGENGRIYKFNNINMISNKDSFFVGIVGNFILIDELSSKHWVLESFFNFGDSLKKGYFNSLEQIDTTFKNGTVIYTFDGKVPPNINQNYLLSIADTFLIPHRLEAATGNAKFVENITYPPPLK